MSQSLFQQYEQDRKYFKPGTILVNNKEDGVVRKLKILESTYLISSGIVKYMIMQVSYIDYVRVGDTGTTSKHIIRECFHLEQ